MDDLISREALLLDLADQTESCAKAPHDSMIRKRVIGLKAAMMVVSEAPTIAAAPVVHARWMHDPHDISTFYAGDCSNCGCAPKRRTMSFKPWNYCPNCGARMDADAPERAGKDGRDE